MSGDDSCSHFISLNFALTHLIFLVCVCVCGSIFQDLKEYTDAEGLMSLPTSDFHKPTVCAGRYKYSITSGDSNMLPRCITAATIDSTTVASASGATSKFGEIRDANGMQTNVYPIETTLRMSSSPNNGGHVEKATHYGNNLIKASFNNSGDLASVDSSDTYASCQTHPFLSQGDLTGEMADISCTLAELDVDDLYFTSLDKDRPSTSVDIRCKSQVKKSASGDASLLSLGACAPMEEVLVCQTNICSFLH